MININPLSELDGTNLDYTDKDLINAINTSKLLGDSIVNIGKPSSNRILNENISSSPIMGTNAFSIEDRYNYLTHYYFSNSNEDS